MRVKPRARRPVEAVILTVVANLEVFVNKNRRMILQEVVNQFSMGNNRNKCLIILSLGMKCGFIMLNLKQKFSQSCGNELVSHLPRS